MPRPLRFETDVQNEVCDDAIADSMAAAHEFESHLMGLAAAFNKLQMSYEGQRADARDVHVPKFVPSARSTRRNSGASVEKLNGSREPSCVHNFQDALVMLADEGLLPGQETGKEVTEMMLRQYKAQFIRLDKAGNGHLEEEDLMAVMQTFNRGWELENIHELLHEINMHAGKGAPASPLMSPGHSGHLVSHGSSRNLTRLHESIDLDGFVALVSDAAVESAMKPRTKRDCKILREALKAENNYNLYKDDGHWTEGTKIRGPTGRAAVLADILPGIVIVMNAIVLGLSSDISPEHDVWKVFNAFFLGFYTLEFITKIGLFGCAWFFRGDEWAWNAFDLFCLAVSWVEEVTTWIVTALTEDAVDLNTMVFIRMLRLTRLVRLVRTLRFEIFYELKMMVLGVVSGMRVLIWAMVLLLVIIYTTGVAAKNVFGAEEPEFNTVPASMFTLFRCFTDGCNAYDGTPLMERMRPKYGVLLVVSYVCMFMLVCLGVFNLIMAIFLENVMVNQLQRKLMGIDSTANVMEVTIKEHLMRLVLRSKSNGVPEDVEQELKQIHQAFPRREARVRAMFETLSSSQVVITKPAFLSWLHDKDFVQILKEADVETANQAGIFECLDADMSGWLTMDEIFQGLMRLRGPVAKSEIVGFCLRLRHVAQLMHGMSD